MYKEQYYRRRKSFTTGKAKDEIKKKKRNIEAWNVPYSIASTKHFNQTSPTLQTFARTDNLPQTPGPWNRLKSSPAFWFEPLAELFACTYRRAWLFGFTPGIGAPVSNYPRTWFKVPRARFFCIFPPRTLYITFPGLPSKALTV